MSSPVRTSCTLNWWHDKRPRSRAIRQLPAAEVHAGSHRNRTTQNLLPRRQNLLPYRQNCPFLQKTELSSLETELVPSSRRQNCPFHQNTGLSSLETELVPSSKKQNCLFLRKTELPLPPEDRIASSSRRFNTLLFFTPSQSVRFIRAIPRTELACCIDVVEDGPSNDQLADTVNRDGLMSRQLRVRKLNNTRTHVPKLTCH